MTDHVTEVHADQETDHVNDQEDRTEEEVDRDHVTEDGIDLVPEIEVILEDMTEDEVDHQEGEDGQDHHRPNIEADVGEDAADLAAVEVAVVVGVIEGAETTVEEITGVAMIPMVSMANRNLVQMMTYPPMDFPHQLLTEVVMVIGVMMTEAVDANLVGIVTAVENADLLTKVKNGQGSVVVSQTDLR